MTVTYSEVYKALLRQCQLLSEKIVEQTGRPVSVVCFDGLGDIGTYPDGDLFGFSDFTLVTRNQEAGMHLEVTFVCSVQEDTNLMRLETEMAPQVVKYSIEEMVIPIFDETQPNLVFKANLVFTGDTLISPPVRDGSRTFKAFRYNLLCDKRLGS